MNSFQLKIIACSLMTIDHIGYIFFPQLVIFRIIGRLSFPIFAFLIGEGFRHTKNLKKYLYSLLAFAIISQPVYNYVLKNGFFNIFFSLFLGLASLAIYKKSTNKTVSLIIVGGISILAALIRVDYGFYGIWLIFIFGVFNIKTEMPKILFWISIITSILIAVSCFYYPILLSYFSIWLYIQIFAIFSLLIIMLYNGKLGPTNKYIFYLFYPAHLLILFLIKSLL